jgi:hypothetical protein
MNTSTDILPTARICGGWLVLRMPTGLEIRFPVADNPRLAKGDARALNHIEVSRTGLHWPDLDEDLSFAGLAQGNYGQKSSLASKK